MSATAGGTGGNGAPGAVYVTWTDPPPPPPIPANLSAYCSADGRTGYMNWSPSSGATGYYIRANDPSTPWAPSCTSSAPDANGDICTPPISGVPPFTFATTPGHSYDTWVHANGPGGASDATSSSFTCPAPATASISVSPQTVYQGSSATLSWSTANAVSGVYITNVGWVSSSGSVQVAPASDTAYQITAYAPGGNATATASLAVLSSCTLDGATVTHGSSRTFYSASTVPQGTVCSSVSQTRTCTDGVLSGSASYQYASCSCAPYYSCAGAGGQTIYRTDPSCATSSTGITCTAPAFCAAGSSSCLYPNPSFSGDNGHLRAVPSLVPTGQTAKVYWQLDNVSSCTVTGDNGDSWSAASSGSAGKTTAPVLRRTTYTLRCTAYPGGIPATIEESATVDVVPVFEEV